MRAKLILFTTLLFLGCSDEESTAGPTGGTDAAAGSGGTGGAGGAAGEPDAGGADADASGPGPAPDYADDQSWICRPGKVGNVCDGDLDAEILDADGTIQRQAFTRSASPAIDCFYVYPTVSLDATLNSDLVAGETEEIRVTKDQAARLGSVCAVYAPLYRQITLSGIFNPSSPDAATARETAYGDVVAAFERYLSEYNGGRGFVVIGHSQGGGHLNRLIRERIDATALRSQLVAAYLIGSAVSVPDGADVGGDFANVPACRTTDQTGCVVSYASFESTSMPPENSLFGRPRSGQGVALCVNPASPAGGQAELTPYFPSQGAFEMPSVTLTEPYVTFPGLLRAECVRSNGFDVLEVTVQADASDPRPDEIGGRLDATWGLHLWDVHLAMGDIERLVTSQAAAYQAN